MAEQRPPQDLYGIVPVGRPVRRLAAQQQPAALPQPAPQEQNLDDQRPIPLGRPAVKRPHSPQKKSDGGEQQQQASVPVAGQKKSGLENALQKLDLQAQQQVEKQRLRVHIQWKHRRPMFSAFRWIHQRYGLRAIKFVGEKAVVKEVWRAVHHRTIRFHQCSQKQQVSRYLRDREQKPWRWADGIYRRKQPNWNALNYALPILRPKPVAKKPCPLAIQLRCSGGAFVRRL